MRTLLVLRHAKSSWDDESLPDHDRPLNPRGLRAAPLMGRWAAEHGALPDAVLSSTALRARHTAALFAEAAGLEADTVIETEALYLAGPAIYVELLRQLPDAVGRAMVVGHNPGLEDLVALLSGRRERMPTAALAVIELPVERWRELTPGTRGSLIAIRRPKELGRA